MTYNKYNKSQHRFAEIPNIDIPRSLFDRSHTVKTTMDSGYLVPIYVDEILPGDTFDMDVAHFTRTATPIVPVMDNLYQDFHFFAVPVRLLWDNWEKFNGAQDDPNDSTDYLAPVINSDTGFASGGLADYFGLPTGVANLNVSSLPFRAYNLIFNEWYRDENLQDSLTVEKGDGPDTADYSLKRRNKRKDYFTSALPWPQKGPGVELPLGTTAPVIGDGKNLGLYSLTGNFGLGHSTTQQLAAYTGLYGQAVGTATSGSNPSQVGLGVTKSAANSGLIADLSSATAATINSLRQAFQLQRLYERDARGGTRYIEILKAHFGVTSPDYRLQRPEYLGGFTTKISMTTVPQTSSTDATTPQGNLSAYGVGGNVKKGFKKSFVEHCIIIGLASVRADLTYQQGINRMWSRRTRFDYYWPALSHLGEQEVLNKEIYAQGNASDSSVFGYQERYAEYRYYPNQITGQFRSTHATSLDIWHYGQEFEALPTLNSTFIAENPPVARTLAVENYPQFLMDISFNIKAYRPMPVYSVPGLVDHF